MKGWLSLKIIDQTTYPRKAHFDYFKTFTYPHFSLCANVDITNFYRFINENNKPFFASFLYAVTRVCNDIPEFRQRIRDDQIVEHDSVNPSFTIMTSQNVFSFYTANYMNNFFRFVEYTLAGIELKKNEVSLKDEEGVDNLIYITSIPWVSFTNITHPIQITPADSTPRISWGRYFTEGDKVMLPLSVQVSHALMDGYHVGIFYEKIQEFLSHPDQYIMSIADSERDEKEKAYDTRIIRTSSLSQRMRSEYPYEMNFQ